MKLLVVGLTIVVSLFIGVLIEAQEDEVPFDTDRGVWLTDSDGDTYPDLTEQLGGTDPFDAADFPGRPPDTIESQASGFPAAVCRAGFTQAGPRLCIDTFVQNATTYLEAAARCRDRRSYVCGSEELFYLYTRTGLDAAYNPAGRWLGDFTADDQVLCGNRNITFNGDPDILNFEGTCNKSGSRNYWCCHDDDV